MTIPASQLNTWMHEHHADTVADLAQRGLAMEFIDARAERRTSLRLSSDKATFGFHLPLSEGFQGQVDLVPMMDSARAASPGFQQAFDGYERVYPDMLLTDRPPLPVRSTLQDRSGWQLHPLPPCDWRISGPGYNGWAPCPINVDLGDVLAQWAVEQAELLWLLNELDIVEAIKDPRKSKYHPISGVFEILPRNSRKFCYFVALYFNKQKKPSSLVVRAIISVSNNRPHGVNALFKDSTCSIDRKGDIYISTNTVQGEKNLYMAKFKPAALGLSNKQAATLFDMDQPIGAGMARNISTEFYDFDFSEVLDTNQDATSGLSL